MKRLFGFFLIMAFAFSCSSTTNKEIESEKESIKGVVSRAEMIDRTRSILENSTNLTKSQRESFLDLHASIMKDVSKINVDIRKSKVVLFNAMVGEKFNQAKVDSLTKSIKKLYDKKLDLMIVGMAKGKEIIGVSSVDLFQHGMPLEHFGSNY
ncbi:MAG: hypothetical protein HOE90_07270 [Bacteriovoracaceae bacterium]|nr:hypothetical protein [Bacteriovoracaceae bacterium]